MNMVKILAFVFLSLVLFGCTSVPTNVATPMDAIGADSLLRAKRMLPPCLHGTSNDSLYKRLEKLGEYPFGAGIEKSKLAMEQKGLSLGFTLDPKNRHWSILSTDRANRTCFVAMGLRWHQTQEETSDKVFKGEGKRVGYSAPFAKMREELLKEGKVLAGFDNQDLDLSGSKLSNVRTYFFTDRAGFFAAATSITYKNSNGSTYEISSIDAVGEHWVWAFSESPRSSAW